MPLHIDIRTNSDGGTPVTVSAPEGPHAAIYRDIAAKVLEAMETISEAGPEIVFE